jgi:hypothetical protein
VAKLARQVATGQLWTEISRRSARGSQRSGTLKIRPVLVLFEKWWHPAALPSCAAVSRYPQTEPSSAIAVWIVTKSSNLLLVPFRAGGGVNNLRARSLGRTPNVYLIIGKRAVILVPRPGLDQISNFPPIR